MIQWWTKLLKKTVHWKKIKTNKKDLLCYTSLSSELYYSYFYRPPPPPLFNIDLGRGNCQETVHNPENNVKLALRRVISLTVLSTIVAVDRDIELLKHLSSHDCCFNSHSWVQCMDQELEINSLDYIHGYKITTFENQGSRTTQNRVNL